MKILCYCVLILCFASSSFAQRWQQASSFPGSTRDGAIAFSIGSKVYFGGGLDKDFFEYDPATDVWTKKGNIPGVSTNRAFGIGFSIGDKGYVGLGQDSGTLKKDLWEYDPSADTWTKKANFIAGIDAPICFTIGGKAYIGGGTDGKYIYSEFYSYDPTTNAWKSEGELPMGSIVFGSAFSIGSKGYVTGGDIGGAELGDLYEYDATTNEWKMLAAFPGTARQTMVSFSINGKGYVGMGQSRYTDVYSDFYSYDPTTDTWTNVSGDFPISPGRAWGTAVAYGDKAFIGAGWDLSTNFYNDWWKYDPLTTASVQTPVTSTAISIYPNPVADRFTISGAYTTGTVTVIDVLGREVFTSAITASRSYDISNITQGQYMIRIESDGHTDTYKIVKN